MTTTDLNNIFGETIHAYTRAQALDDGYLIDVSETAREAGFQIPVVITRTAWADWIEWTDVDSHRQTYQDEAGRLWDVLYMAANAARRSADAELRFQLYRVPRGGRGQRARLTTLKAVIDGGDNGQPCITLMLPDED
jgi:hypothetical protein